MKLNLIVMTAGTMQGKAIPITLSQFLIGRDKQCHLRPASPIISNRHCALQVRGDKVFVRDFESTNGTYVNEIPVKGEMELHDRDSLRLGPMLFTVQLERTPAPVTKLAPAQPAPAPAVDDEDMAALLLSLPEDADSDSRIRGMDSQGVPTGSTVMDLPVPATVDEAKPAEAGSPGAKGPHSKSAVGDTAAAADSLLKKYRRQKK